ncbi:ACP S-malonyltransferase [Scleromatobacter humisilvae]|uniref:Acyltransferase domain-containing protein n=1 Tax=Scleromatobacter humisilvae TaxID=2897159 RepID=A0A9X1YQ15_9BURK|nr:acyltransferase domain-containing protein [Scleromatobacter humisilvae]MCK9689008.1 acyltransferase domain-containing protein [Scleromatobacter humisilvae]
MSVALLFPGQGTQQPAMLPWLEADDAARPMLAQLANVLGSDWRTHLEDTAWSQSNAVAQPLVTGVSVAAWSALASSLPRVVAIAGYSVGEIAACVAAAMLTVDDAMRLAVRRAAAMDACAVDGAAGLLGVSDVAAADIGAACARWGLEIAIRTGERRCVLGGPAAALAEAATRLAVLGAKTTPLGVRVASHTRAMRAAVPALAQALAQARWHAPRVAWVAGITGAVVRDVAEVRRVLAEQVATTVRWDTCMDTVAERRPDAVLEVGAGTTLARLWRERHPSIPVRSCDEFASAAQAVRWAATIESR